MRKISNGLATIFFADETALETVRSVVEPVAPKPVKPRGKVWAVGSGIMAAPDVDPAFRTAMLRGRPLGSGKKESVTLRLDKDVLEALRASGKGWQTRVNEMLRGCLEKE